MIARAIECGFVAETLVPLQCFSALSALGIPEFNETIRGCTCESLALGVVAEGPNTLLVALQSEFALVSWAIPKLDGLIVGGTGKLLFRKWIYAKSINRVFVFW